ncbi:hypothetical protein [Micromonospora coerulea]|uniref:hypothetical protein n=1 Tax=Micromonospora coerulea TaxID=47856 RepID=UPI0019062A15|nr:hypothetical protein [Micromonospora veneta]
MNARVGSHHRLSGEPEGAVTGNSVAGTWSALNQHDEHGGGDGDGDRSTPLVGWWRRHLATTGNPGDMLTVRPHRVGLHLHR